MSVEWLVDERGSALLLMPTGVLIVLILGAMAVDAAVLFLGARELSDVTAAAANDAAVAALRHDAFYDCGQLRLDGERVREVAAAVATARGSDSVQLDSLSVQVRNDSDPPQVTVGATGSVRLVFTPALPGGARMRSVAARSTAVPRMAGPEGAAGACDQPAGQSGESPP